MVLAIRPQPGCDATVAAAAEMGLRVEGHPLFEICPRDWDAPDPALFDALLIGSANAVRHAGEALALYRHLPVHAVGPSTAQVAQAAGLRVERVGEGGLQDILDRVTGPIRYLRLAGVEHVELATARAVTITLREVYDSAALPLSDELAGRLREGRTLVLLHSASAARHFAAECDRLAISRSGIALACLGPRVAEAAGEGWAALESAQQPGDSSLLALARDMCH